MERLPFLPKLNFMKLISTKWNYSKKKYLFNFDSILFKKKYFYWLQNNKWKDHVLSNKRQNDYINLKILFYVFSLFNCVGYIKDLNISGIL